MLRGETNSRGAGRQCACSSSLALPWRLSEGSTLVFTPSGCQPRFFATFLLNAVQNLDRCLEEEDYLENFHLKSHKK